MNGVLDSDSVELMTKCSYDSNYHSGSIVTVSSKNQLIFGVGLREGNDIGNKVLYF